MSRYLSLANLPARAEGDTWPVDLVLTDGDGVALDVTGYAFALAVNVDENPADPATTNVAEIDGTITDATAGAVRFPGADLGTLDVPADEAGYWYTVKLTNDDGATATVMKGRLPITGSIA